MGINFRGNFPDVGRGRGVILFPPAKKLKKRLDKKQARWYNKYNKTKKGRKKMKVRKITEYRVMEDGKCVATFTKKKFATIEAKRSPKRTVEKVEVESIDF